MKLMVQIYQTIKKFIYKHIRFFVILFTVFSFFAVTPLWWLSILSILFFLWNFFNENKYRSKCIASSSIAILLIIFNFAVIQPANEWGKKIKREWDTTGYNENYLKLSQQNINVIARTIEQYKLRHGDYPDELDDMNDFFIHNLDYSYRVRQADGQVNGIRFYYEKINADKFFLAGVGKDGTIKTEDDLLVQISLEQEKTTGLQKYVVKSFAPEELEKERGIIEMFKKVKKLDNLQNTRQ